MKSAIDRGFAFEHNLAKLSSCIVIVETNNNQMSAYDSVLTDLVAAIQIVKPGAVRYVSGHGRGKR
jgi:hypothetical protein